MKTFLFIAIFIGVWVALQVWILPKMGVST
ncbi:hypothetical protein HNR65_000219 [Desulfosalsimonas propionicica]|jgi:hypothetical protein|uniref:Uncharacterized protein n=1 Tax=Desulfosalsimonas propionicica TaxID=332175 RepID=A0A7W0C6A8_9BACT|nr:hypothetical protein [Desulfosalsimonas propionicica]